MEQERLDKIQQVIREGYRRFAPTMDKYQWPREESRWHELVFCLLVSSEDSSASIATARETVEIFANLDLLVVDELANLVPDKGEPDYQQPQLALMLSILDRQGYYADEAKTIVTTICEAARAIGQGFDGKLQKYLRKYGELMLAEVHKHFSFSCMQSDKIRYVFTNWLQNVLNMPLACSRPSVQAFCKEFKISVEELIDLADRNNVNLALLDDWVADYMVEQKREREIQRKTWKILNRPSTFPTIPSFPTIPRWPIGPRPLFPDWPPKPPRYSWPAGPWPSWLGPAVPLSKEG